MLYRLPECERVCSGICKVINNFAFYIDMVKQVQYDPQKVGKSSLSYKVADIVLQNIMNEMLA